MFIDISTMSETDSGCCEEREWRSHFSLLPTAYLDLVEADRGGPGVRKLSAAELENDTPPGVFRLPEQFGL